MNRLTFTANSASSMRTRGQALAEFAVVATILVGMGLALPMLWKVMDVNHAAISAARYAAWERTVAAGAQKSDAKLRGEVQRRFFEDVAAPFRTSQLPGGKPEDVPVAWELNDETPIIDATARSVALAMRSKRLTSGEVAGFETMLTEIAGALSKIDKDLKSDLKAGGLVEANVAVAVSPFERYGFETDKAVKCGGAKDVFTCINRKNVILTDSWGAANQEQVIDRTQGFVPAAIAADWTDVFNKLSAIPGLSEFDEFEPGIVMPDVVPPDRLGKK